MLCLDLMQVSRPVLFHLRLLAQSIPRVLATPEQSVEPFRKLWKGTFIAAGGYKVGRTACLHEEELQTPSVSPSWRDGILGAPCCADVGRRRLLTPGQGRSQ